MFFCVDSTRGSMYISAYTAVVGRSMYGWEKIADGGISMHGRIIFLTN